MTYDSVSFENSLMPNDFDDWVINFTDRELIQISYIPSSYPIPSISSTGGLVGTLWLTILAQATPGFVPIDSASLDTTIGWVGAILANSTGTTTWFPDCIGGGVNIIEVQTSIRDDSNGSLPTSFALAQNYPNPFNPMTVIEYSLAQAGPAKLEVFNVLGQNISTLVDGPKVAGNHQVEFDASVYPSGIFFYRLTQGEKSQTKKMVLVK